MHHQLNIPDLIVGGMLLISSAFALIFTRSRRETIRGITYKQFVWLMVIVFIGGALTAAWQFIFGP